MDGTQTGDPAKASAAIITAVESNEPPAFLLVRPDPSPPTAISRTAAPTNREMGKAHGQYQFRRMSYRQPISAPSLPAE
jgi:hypothetical protein